VEADALADEGAGSGAVVEAVELEVEGPVNDPGTGIDAVGKVLLVAPSTGAVPADVAGSAAASGISS